MPPCDLEGAYYTSVITIRFGGTDPGFNYEPKCLRVPVGTTVTFTGDFATHPLAPSALRGMTTGNPIRQTTTGTTASFTFSAPGFYAYTCRFHGADDGQFMDGVIWVGGGSLPVADLISDFEDVAAATVVRAGSPERNGYWYAFNDDNPRGVDPTCVQVPRSGPQTLPGSPERYVGVAPPGGVRPGSSGALALRGKWTGCTIWGAGIGADLLTPSVPDGGTYTGPRVRYDVTPYTGDTFWARAEFGSDTALRIKFPMTRDTKVEDGGICIESATNKCGDHFGWKFNLPTDGSWKQITVRWADAVFAQEGWGAPFSWVPQDVTSIQIQSQNKGEPYDFYLDDLYFIR